MGIIAALSATGLAAGLALTGAHVASASTGVSSPAAGHASITLPAGGVLEQRVTRFCNRVPKLIQRADKAQTRLSGDADTRGSLAWLKAREAKAKANGNTRVVSRLDRRITRRTDRLAKLPDVKTQLSKADDECATLDLPTPSASPSDS